MGDTRVVNLTIRVFCSGCDEPLEVVMVDCYPWDGTVIDVDVEADTHRCAKKEGNDGR